jgi:lysophospholipase L1-like esterase
MEHVCNYIKAETDKQGFAHFYRFFDAQLKEYAKNSSFKVLSLSTTGVVIRFVTTGDEVRFTAKSPRVLKQALEFLKQVTFSDVVREISRLFTGTKEKTFDAIDLLVDDVLTETRRIQNGVIRFRFKNPEHRPREVTICLPEELGIACRDLRANGPIGAAAARKQMLSLGDSITQGSFSGTPSKNYVSLLARKLGMDAVNQGVGGYVFRAESLSGLERLPEPALVTVAYGTNDWATIYDFDVIELQVSSYFKKLAALFPAVPIYAITPLWRADMETASASGEPLERIAEVIGREAAKYGNIRVVDGFGLVPHDPALFADGLHPNSKGFAHYAENLYKIIRSSPPRIS